jgi:hypothetical protein
MSEHEPGDEQHRHEREQLLTRRRRNGPHRRLVVTV